MKINFYLNKKNNDSKEHQIMVYVRGYERTITKSVDVKVYDKNWNAKKQQVKNSDVNCLYKNQYLRNLKTKLERLDIEINERMTELTFNEIKARYTNLIKPEHKKVKSFVEYFSMYIAYKEAEKNKFRTIQKYEGVKNHLMEYEKQKKVCIQFNDIDKNFMVNFRGFLIDDKNLTNNTVEKIFSVLKGYLNWCSQEGYNSNNKYKTFKLPKEETEIIVLTDKELMSLYYHNFDKPHHQKVRDVFCFACFTGQRWGDVSTLEWKDIENRTWNLRDNKTKSFRKIPLSVFAYDILQKYKTQERPLPIMSHQKTNDYIKEICKKVGIDKLETITRYKGSTPVEKTLPKWNFISTHTGRRTFITLSLAKGLRQHTVMKLSGHTTYRAFQRYVKVSDEMKTEELNNIWNEVNFKLQKEKAA